MGSERTVKAMEILVRREEEKKRRTRRKESKDDGLSDFLLWRPARSQGLNVTFFRRATARDKNNPDISLSFEGRHKTPRNHFQSDESS